MDANIPPSLAQTRTFLLGLRRLVGWGRRRVRRVDEAGRHGGRRGVPRVVARPRLAVEQPQLVVHHALRPERVLLRLGRQVAKHAVDGGNLQREDGEKRVNQAFRN